ncbi:hypothetical protein DL769_008252 [Monosporascus sp. CRB-8-3]|nr:hypothetical protein DL769_008252 [Monosporascus sp. CRB-8-3]
MKFTIVICPGAWPRVQFFEPLIQAFEAKHHTAICKVPLTYPVYSPGNTPEVNPDSEYLRTHVLEPMLEEGRDIVIFMHSYGGVYGPESLEGISKKEREAKGLKGGVIAIIFNAAVIAPKGTTAIAAMGLDSVNLPEWVAHDATGLVAFEKERAKAMLFHDLPDEEAERLANMLPKQSYVCLSTPTHWDPYQDPNFQGTFGYIFTEADRIVPLEAQQMYVRMAAIEKTHLLKESSHSPHIKRPEELAEAVLNLVGAIAEGSCA